jgi:hypothetical protein
MAIFSSKNPKFTEEEKRRIVEGTDDKGMPLSDREKVKLENMFTSRVLGDDWRKRLKDKDPNKEQKALDAFVDINQDPQYESPLQGAVTKTKIKTPSGGSVQYGIDTLARMRDTEAQNKAQEVARKEKFNTSLVSMQQNAANTLKKRYEDELASRGFAPPQNRQEQEAIDRARMEDFRLRIGADEDAKRAEKTALTDYSNYKKAARQAKLNKDFGAVAYYESEASKINNSAGGDITNVTARRSFFKDQANKDLMREINASTEERKQKTQKQTTSNPEASSFIPQSTNAPIGAGYDSLSYESRARPLDATEQPFGLIPPNRQDYGVDFSGISPYNLTQSDASESSVSGAGEKTSSAEGENLPIPFVTYKEENQFPGISKIPRLKRNQDESVSQYNARVLQEYNKNVIIPSFDKKTQEAVISAMELNKLEPSLFKQRLSSPENLKEHTRVSAKLKEDRKVIVKTMNELKPKLRNYNKYPANSKERAFLENQFGTLNKQLGFFDDLLN